MDPTTVAQTDKELHVEKMMYQPQWQRITLLSILGYEAAGALAGGILLLLEPDGRLMDMPVSILNGVFPDFQIPGIILLGLGILITVSFFSVLRRAETGWMLAGLGMGGLTIWFGVEIAVLHVVHWLHGMWGLPVLVADMLIIPLIPSRHATWRKAALLCGILSSFLYVLATVLGAAQWAGYSSASQTVSELIGINSPSASLVIPLFVVYSLLILAFSSGVWNSAGDKRALRIAALLIAAKEVIGIFGTFLAPVHMRGVEGTSSDTWHAIMTAVGVLLCMFPAMGFAAAAIGRRFRVYTVATMIVFLVFGVLSAFDGPSLAQNLPTPWLGLYERINIFAYLLWIVVLAIRLLPDSEPQQMREVKNIGERYEPQRTSR